VTKKTLFAAILVLLLLISVSAENKGADAQSLQAVTIAADGIVNPPSAPIQKESAIYTLTADFNGSITIEKGSIIFDGAGHSLQGPGIDQNRFALNLMASNVIVENLRLTNWKTGVLGSYNNNTIAFCEFTQNQYSIAIYAYDYVVFGNNISNSMYGCFIKTGALRTQGDNNLILQNRINNNQAAFDIYYSNGTTISKNNVTSNEVILTVGAQEAKSNVAGFHLLYLNNFVNNSKTLRVPFAGPFISAAVTMSPAGQWDNNSIGNYWSDYQSKYPNATQIDNSGIGNTHYMIEDSGTYTGTYANGTAITGTAVLGNAVDHYPLMAPVPGASFTLNLTLPSSSQTPPASPTAEPTPTVEPSPSPTPISTPTPPTSPTTEPTSTPPQTPNPTLEPSNSVDSLPMVVGIVIVIAVAVLGALVCFKKQKRTPETL